MKNRQWEALINLIKYIFFPSLIVFLLGSKSDLNKSFNIVMETPPGMAETNQTRAELEMSRSVKFCRGFKIPVRIGRWSCKNFGRDNRQCRVNYNCDFINKKFSRITETRRLLKRLRGLKKNNAPLKLLVRGALLRSTKIVELKVKNRLNNKKIDNSNFKKEGDNKSAVGSTGLKKDLNVEDESIEIDIDKDTLDLDSQFVNSDITSSVKDELGKDSKDLSGGEETIEETIKNYRLLNFNLSHLFVIDPKNDFSSALYLAWTPIWELDYGFSFKLHLGNHRRFGQFGEYEEYFHAIDVGSSFIFQLGDHLSFQLGRSYQKWFSSIENQFWWTLIGGSLTFSEKAFLGLIEGLFFNIHLFTEDRSSEINIGLNFTF